ncbi:unnamed protein product [Lathyrus sativus]|nr:unnamed protein product [Lathyrus sativus]
MLLLLTNYTTSYLLLSILPPPWNQNETQDPPRHCDSGGKSRFSLPRVKPRSLARLTLTYKTFKQTKCRLRLKRKSLKSKRVTFDEFDTVMTTSRFVFLLHSSSISNALRQ